MANKKKAKETYPLEVVKVSSNEYCLRSHDSFRISNGFWNWHSKNIGGSSAIDLLSYATICIL